MKTNALLLTAFVSLLFVYCKSEAPVKTNPHEAFFKELSAAHVTQKEESLVVAAFFTDDASDGEVIASSFTRQPVLRDAFKKITLITQNEIAAINFRQRMPDTEMIFELGNALNASHVIAGYITQFENSSIIIASLMDVEKLQQIAGDYRIFKSIEEVDKLIPDIAKKLAGAVPRSTANLPGLLFPPFNISEDVNMNDSIVLSRILACDLANGNKFAVLPRTEYLDTILKERGRGRGRYAQYALSGSAQKLGALNIFSADVLNIFDGSYMHGLEESYRSSEQGLELIPALAVRLTIPESAPKHIRSELEKFELALSLIKEADGGAYTITLAGDIVLDSKVDFSGFG